MARRARIAGPAGAIEVASELHAAPSAIAVIAHPHPLHGGTMDNKVVTTLERALRESGATTVRFNFRGVGETEGTHDEGEGETEDMLHVIAHARESAPDTPLWLAGFSFGGAIALRASARVEFARLVLVAPALRRLTGEGLGAVPHPDDPHLGEIGRHTHANTFIVHGDKDETVVLADSLEWGAAREVPVVVVPGADHFFHRKLHIIRDVVGRMVKA